MQGQGDGWDPKQHLAGGLEPSTEVLNHGGSMGRRSLGKKNGAKHQKFSQVIQKKPWQINKTKIMIFS